MFIKSIDIVLLEAALCLQFETPIADSTVMAAWALYMEVVQAWLTVEFCWYGNILERV